MLEALVDNQKYLGPARCHIRALQGKRNCVITSRVVSAYPSGNHVVWAWIPHSCAGESVPRPKPSSLEEKPGDSAWSLHVNQPAQGHRTPSAQSPEKQEGPQGFPQIFGIRRNGVFPRHKNHECNKLRSFVMCLFTWVQMGWHNRETTNTTEEKAAFWQLWHKRKVNNDMYQKLG